MRSLIFISFLIVSITISINLPFHAFGNTPGEPGYIPPNNLQPSTDGPIKFNCLIGDALLKVQPDEWWSAKRGLVTTCGGPVSAYNAIPIQADAK